MPATIDWDDKRKSINCRPNQRTNKINLTMEQNIQYLLIDRLDNILSGNDLNSVEAMMRNDEATAREWNFLRVAVDAIQSAALYDQVSNVRKQFKQSQTVSAKPQGAIVRTMYRNTMRIAAGILLLI